MLLDAAILTIVVGLIGGGRVGWLKDLGLRAPAVFVAAALVRIALVVMGAREAPATEQIGGALHVATYLVVLLGLWLNRHLRAMWVVALGVALNVLVIAANGGSMPVDRELAGRAGNTELVRMMESPRHVIHTPVTAETRLKPLADVLLLPPPYPNPHVFSVGDVFVTIGGCWLLLVGLGAFGLGRARGAAPREETEPEAGERQP